MTVPLEETPVEVSPEGAVPRRGAPVEVSPEPEPEAAVMAVAVPSRGRPVVSRPPYRPARRPVHRPVHRPGRDR